MHNSRNIYCAWLKCMKNEWTTISIWWSVKKILQSIFFCCFKSVPFLSPLCTRIPRYSADFVHLLNPCFLTPCPSWKSPHFVQVLEICVAIVVHKSIIVFSLAVKLVQSGVPPLWLAAYVGVFAMMSPVGIAIGISVMEAQLSSGALIQAVLEGLAAGTFVYITFLEILPHELNSSGKQLLKVLFILLGFGIMAALTLLAWDRLESSVRPGTFLTKQTPCCWSADCCRDELFLWFWVVLLDQGLHKDQLRPVSPAAFHLGEEWNIIQCTGLFFYCGRVCKEWAISLPFTFSLFLSFLF